MRILYDNKVDSNTISSQSEDANYPDDNLAVTSLKQTYRAGSCAAEWVRIDAGTGNTITATAVAIGGHNFTSSVTVIVHAASTATAIASAPTVSVAVSYLSGVMMSIFASGAERYWQFDIEDPTNSDGYIEMGRIFVGPNLQPDPGSYAEFDMHRKRTDNTVFSISNQVYGDIGVEYWDIVYKFPWSSSTAYSNILTFYDDVGKYQPFFFTNYSSVHTTISPIYAILGSDITFKHFERDFFEFALHIREVD